MDQKVIKFGQQSLPNFGIGFSRSSETPFSEMGGPRGVIPIFDGDTLGGPWPLGGKG